MPCTHVLIDQSGPLPLSANFATSGTEQMIHVSGSFWSGDGDIASALILNVDIDGEHLGALKLMRRHSDAVHIPISKQFVAQLTPGRHSISITAGNSDTHTGQHDLFDVTLLDL